MEMMTHLMTYLLLMIKKWNQRQRVIRLKTNGMTLTRQRESLRTMLLELNARPRCALRSTSAAIAICEEQSGERLDPIDVSIALIALKARHHLSNNCIGDILALLRLLGIHLPSSYKALYTLLKKRSSTHLSPSTKTICPHCQKLSFEMRKCTACASSYSPIPPSDVPVFYTYDISCQLQAVLATTKDLSLCTVGRARNGMRDITDGDVYKNLIANESGPFITLTMNVDGIQPNKGPDQSLWPILFVINEIDRKKRFSLQNLIIGGMWPGPSKPSRIQISLLFEHAISELQDLEKGHLFQLYSPDDSDYSETIKVF